MATDASLGDILAGAAGRPVNRVALNATVQQGQALAGLRTAQTEDALAKAEQARIEMNANDRLEDSLFNVLTATGDPHAVEHAKYSRDVMVGGHGNAQVAEQSLGDMLKNINTQALMDPTKLGSPAQTAAQQGVAGKVAEPVAVPENFTTLPGAYQPNAQQTPLGAAHTQEDQARADLATAQAKNPSAFHPGALGSGLPPELQQAVDEGRLDPTRINSRNVAVYSQLAQGNPALNFNKMHADAALQSNPTFQQRSITIEALPTVMSHMTSLGKEIGYSDWRTVGKMQQFMNGEFNDPKYAEYMAVRNDTLMSIANVMRGVGMSDQAHRAEVEAASPTMSPLALDGWLKGQMSSLKPRYEEFHRVHHLGEKPSSDTPGGGATTPPAAGFGPDPNDPFGLR